MVTVSYDPEVRALYWYFAEIETGAVALEGECAATLLLDGDGQVIGCELELDESIDPRDLVFALGHAQVRYQAADFTLTVLLAGEEPATIQPLAEPAILDFDAAESLLGFEVQAAPEFDLGERLARLRPFLVSAEEPDEDAAQEPGTADQEPRAGSQASAAGPASRAATEEREPPDGEPARPVAADDSAPVIGEQHDAPASFADASEAAPATLAPDAGVVADEAGEPPAAMPAAQPVLNEPPARSAIGPASAVTRSGFVAIVGRPNVGKSTLLNALLGQKVAIVSRKPQTTRTAIRGILTHGDAQLIFVDTPGIHQPRNRLGNFMVEQARRAIPDADVVCFVVDISEPPGKLDEQIAGLVRRGRAPKLLVLNKVDLRTEHGAQNLDAYRALLPWDMELAISALRGEGLPTLVDELVKRLPAGTALYPTDQVTDQNERDLAAELVREQVLRNTEEEVPHSVAVEVEEWEQKEKALYIRMTVYVEKDSQKGILIGAGGAMLKKIGSAARRSIERELGRQVFLDLWVKPRPNWRDDPSSLRWLGYQDS